MIKLPIFTGDFTQQAPLPQAAKDAAARVLETARLHRYNLADGDDGDVARLERAYGNWQGRKYCLAVTSGGQAMQIALRALEAKNQKILTNAFTLAPVPGAIEAIGSEAVLVESDENLRIDLDDLDQKAKISQAKFLLLSHMRGHLADMDALMTICDHYGITVIEDCAHTMGAKWNGKRSGNFGHASCFSTQTYKHINSGEGGLLVSDDPKFMARATIMSGSYMLYSRHGAGPSERDYADARENSPNCSARMDHLRAAILIPQLDELEENIQNWNARYHNVSAALSGSKNIVQPIRPNQESMVGSSIQFRVPRFDDEQKEQLIDLCAEHGVEIKWFGRTKPHGFTSSHKSWAFVPKQNLPKTDMILSSLFDMRIPLSFSLEDCTQIGQIIAQCADRIG